MQFIAQLPLPDAPDESKLLLLFLCQNSLDCEPWDAESGANGAFVVERSGTTLPAPDGDTTLRGVSHLELSDYDEAEDEDAASEQYHGALAENRPMPLGKLGGGPIWLQADQTPTCECGSAMSFVAQLEEWGGGGINFGDAGWGYAFVCSASPHAAKFLWQCC